MAITLVNNLYPPVIESYMPAYIQETSGWTYKVNVTISQFNSFVDLRADATQILITNINNENMAKTDSNYLIKELYQEDPTNPLDKNCYFELTSADVQGGIIPLNTYYKIQVRFSSKECSTPPAANISEWLNDNEMYFSEWSTVCLLSVVTEPSVKLISISTNTSLPQGDIGTITTGPESFSANELVDLKLEMSFPQGKTLQKNEGVWSVAKDDVDCIEAVKKCTIKLYDEKKKLLLESGSLYPETDKRLNVVYNVINYTLKWNLIEGKQYYIIFKFTTSKMLERYYYLYFIVASESSLITSSSFEKIVDIASNLSMMGCGTDENLNSYFYHDIDNGRIAIGIKKSATEKVYLRRASSENNFNTWEDIKYYGYITPTDEHLIAYDITAKSGVAYKYALQGIKEEASKTIRKSNESINCYPILYDDIFLISQNKILTIRYNASVSNYKRNVSDAKIETIGSTYPFVRRNGHMDYKQISISGYITSITDLNEIFETKEDILKGLLQVDSSDKTFYDEYKEQYRINSFNDIVLEREFRNKVSDFLYEDSIKLFKSSQEGNMLLRLMDISFSPEKQLGRQIYSFTCTGYEIAEDTVDNYKKYNIYNVIENEVIGI